MEYACPCVHLTKFIRKNRGHFNEEIARRIMLQLTVTLCHCVDRGVCPAPSLRNIVISPDTLRLKLLDLKRARYVPRACELSFSKTVY